MIARQLKPWGVGWNTQGNALAQMRRDMETLMERLTGLTGDGSVAGLFPPMKVSEDLDHYYLRALIPGIDASQLDVSVVNQTIAVSGTRQSRAGEGVS